MSAVRPVVQSSIFIDETYGHVGEVDVELDD
jgi:hypothetical protein